MTKFMSSGPQRPHRHRNHELAFIIHRCILIRCHFIDFFLIYFITWNIVTFMFLWLGLTSVSLPQTVHLVLMPDLGRFCLFSYAPRQPVLQNSWKDSLESTCATMVPFMFVMSLKSTNASQGTDRLTSTKCEDLVKRIIVLLVFKCCVLGLKT